MSDVGARGDAISRDLFLVERQYLLSHFLRSDVAGDHQDEDAYRATPRPRGRTSPRLFIGGFGNGALSDRLRRFRLSQPYGRMRSEFYLQRLLVASMDAGGKAAFISWQSCWFSFPVSMKHCFCAKTLQPRRCHRSMPNAVPVFRNLPQTR